MLKYLTLIPKEFDHISANLVKKHVIAFLISLSTVVLSFFMIYQLLNMQKDDAHLINISGKQRLNCQKSAFIALFVGTSKTKSYREGELNNLTKEIENAFLEIEPHLKKIGFGELKTLKEALTHQSKLIKELVNGDFKDNKTLSMFLHNSNNMIEYFDLATKSLEEHSQEKLNQTKNIVILLLFVLLLMLVIEATFIFKPAISESARRNKELNALNKTLEDRVTYEVEENRKKEFMLIQKTKQAEIGELMNSIAHQWRNPLTIISLYIDDSRSEIQSGCEKMDANRVVENLDKADATIGYMSKTVEDFRSFYLPSTKVSVFNIYDSVKKVEKLLSYLFMHYKIDLKKSFFDKNGEKIDETKGENLYFAYGKCGEFEQCLMVILNNAKDAINSYKKEHEEGYDGVVEICIYDKAESVDIDIKDNGPGIPDSIKTSLFEPFFTTKGDDGSGVGLYMCKSILKKHFNGDVLLLSSRPKETVFRVNIEKNQTSIM